MVRTLAAIEDDHTWTGTQTLQDSLVVQGVNAAAIPLIVKGLSGQSANLVELQDNTGAPAMKLDVGGNIQVATVQPVATPETGAIFSFNSNMAQVVQRSAGAVVLAVRGAASQTGDLQQWTTSIGGVLAAVTAEGKLKSAAANEQTTVGAAGGASNVPAAPAKYLLVKDSAGTTLAIPMFAAT